MAAKFDESKTQTLTGIVTLVDWRNPHVHVFLNVRGAKGEWVNWAIELDSLIDLQDSGWNRNRCSRATYRRRVPRSKRLPSALVQSHDDEPDRPAGAQQQVVRASFRRWRSGRRRWSTWPAAP